MNNIKSIIKYFAVPFFTFFAWLSRKWASHTHKMLFYSEWFYNAPENFDHQIDRYYTWGKSRNPFWLERGIYNLLAVQKFEQPKVVELCCGDGFNSFYFYSFYSDHVYACDYDKSAITLASKKYKCSNVSYSVLDIREGISKIIPNNFSVTNVIWDTAMAYFSPEEIHSIMKDISKILLNTNGILSGHTIKSVGDGKEYFQHKYEFKDKEDLMRFFTPYFKNVIIFETKNSNRNNFYFYASNGVVPFSCDWDKWITHS